MNMNRIRLGHWHQAKPTLRPVGGGSGEGTAKTGPGVLIVDDESEVRAVIREYLEALGHQVLEASNGLEALWNVKHHRPRAVVLDLIMPRLGGLDTIRHIQRFDPTIRIVVLSAYLTPDTAAILQAFGVATLSKPADLAELHRRLGEPPSAG